MAVYDPSRLGPEEGWETLGSGRRAEGAPAAHHDDSGPAHRQRNAVQFFVPSHPVDDRLALVMYRRVSDDTLVGKAWFGPGALGAPGHVHGGALVAVADQALGHASWYSGHPSFTARLEYDFRRRVPIDSVLIVETEVGEPKGRKLWPKARLWLGEELVGEVTSLFLLIPEGTLKDA